MGNFINYDILIGLKKLKKYKNNINTEDLIINKMS